MPRPGPRPYECVRRAWHSDRHQPIRGSLIQEIFRIVNEVHTTATRKNKEWQEKLPIVVLKAEEIMYSKANSEAEYVDLKTLWDRVNDAIDTIIRKDETTETGKFLQPCIEAALHLGCPPKRSTRSQRNDNPRYCFSQGTSQASSVPLAKSENKFHEYFTHNHPVKTLYPKFVVPTNINSSNPSTEFHCSKVQSCNQTTKLHSYSAETSHPCVTYKCDPVKPYLNSFDCCSVYPLYYGDPVQSETFKVDPSSSQLNSTLLLDADKKNAVQNVLCKQAASKVELDRDFDDQSQIECDLSLRLGPLEVPCISIKSSWPRDIKYGDLGNSQEVSKLRYLSQQSEKEFSFFPEAIHDDMMHLRRCSCNNNNNQKLGAEATTRKRKMVFSHPYEMSQLCWKPKLPFKHC